MLAYDYSSGEGMGKSQIVLIEDNADHLELIIQAFRRILPDRAIQTFTTCEAALQYIRSQTAASALLHAPEIELVVLDLDLPDASGLKVLQALKQHRLLREIPVVILSNVDSQPEIDRAMTLGAEEYIIKPFAFRDLSRTIEKIANQFCVF